MLCPFYDLQDGQAKANSRFAGQGMQYVSLSAMDQLRNCSLEELRHGDCAIQSGGQAAPATTPAGPGAARQKSIPVPAQAWPSAAGTCRQIQKAAVTDKIEDFAAPTAGVVQPPQVPMGTFGRPYSAAPGGFGGADSIHTARHGYERCGCNANVNVDGEDDRICSCATCHATVGDGGVFVSTSG